MADIKLIKFTSGEEIIATIVSQDTEKSLVVKDAITLVYRPTQEGGGAMSVGFAPFMPYAEGEVLLYASSMAAITDVKEDLAKEYDRIFGAGIVIAQANDSIYKA
jgi:hypothetical protein